MFEKFFLYVVLVFALSSCMKDKFLTDSSAKLSFSTDTVQFDTLFTNQGTRTLRFFAINKNNGILKIDKIQLARGEESEFFLNINGVPGNVASNIDLGPNDSIAIFVQGKLLENGHDSLQVHQDSIEFYFNNSYQDIDVLVAGQDVHHIKNANSLNVMQGMKPYYIYDSLVVPEGETLIIEEGVRVYPAHGANIIVYGSLQINGTVENTVEIISGDPKFHREELSGKWGSIIFKSTSSGNKISNCTIANCVNGILIEYNEHPVDLTLENCIVKATNYACLLAQGAKIDAANCVFANSDRYILQLSKGGTYVFNHITLDRVNQNKAVARPKLYASKGSFEFPEDSLKPLSVTFNNSIVMISSPNDVILDGSDNVLFSNCLIGKLDDWVKDYPNFFKNCISYEYSENLYADFSRPILFKLDTLSQAMNKGSRELSSNFQFDILGNNRLLDTLPDLGAYEYYYEEED